MKEIIPTDRPLKFGICLATRSAVAYIHLNLACLAKHEPNVKVIVQDDDSSEQGELRELCRRYGAGFVSPSHRLQPTVGDLKGFCTALELGMREELDVVVKCSRRFVIDKTWSEASGQIMQNTQYATLCAPDSFYEWGYRSECVGMHVQSWVESGVYDEMKETVRINRPWNSLPEAGYHNWTRKVHAFVHNAHPEASFAGERDNPSCDMLVRSERAFPRPDSYAAYAWWSNVMGLSRHQRIPNQLWHDISSPFDYLALSQKYGLPYAVEDFLVVPGQ